MFSWFKKRDKTPAEEKLEKIKNMLFPELETQETLDNEGKLFRIQIDRSVDSNLDSALTDLQDGKNDKIIQDTITVVMKQLFQVRQVLEAYTNIDKEAKYIIVDNQDLGSDNDEIEAVDK
jgi:hypothetical protein